MLVSDDSLAKFPELKPSRFLYELPQDDLNWESSQVKKTPEKQQATAKMGVAGLRAMLDAKKKS